MQRIVTGAFLIILALIVFTFVSFCRGQELDLSGARQILDNITAETDCVKTKYWGTYSECPEEYLKYTEYYSDTLREKVKITKIRVPAYNMQGETGGMRIIGRTIETMTYQMEIPK